MDLNQRISAFTKLGKRISYLFTNENENGYLSVEDKGRVAKLLLESKSKNNWFTEMYVRKSMNETARNLNKINLEKWLRPYHPEIEKIKNPKTIGVIMAGNIPLVGFHDMLCVLLSGHNIMVRFASDDNVLMKFIIETLNEIEPRFKDQIFVTNKLKGMDAVIATGSNNTSRYFESYFGKYPHIIRKNRNAIAVLDGNESVNDLKAFGNDVFDYFGLGCRNVSKVFISENYNTDKLFEAFQSYSHLMECNKYMNNFDMHSAILLLKQVPFLTNNFLILLEDVEIPSPIAILHYEYYSDLEIVKNNVKENKENIQCVVSNISGLTHSVNLGESQSPGLEDYADGKDTLQFLLKL